MPTFANTQMMTIPSPSTTDGSTGVVTQVAVSGISGRYKVSITLNGMFHAKTGDLDFLLVAPDGLSNLEFWSDIGNNGDLNSVNVTVADYGTALLPGSDASVASGTYRATDYTLAPNGTPANPGTASPETAASWGLSGLTVNHPGPAGGATFTSSFAKAGANGVWKLYMRDDATGATGSIDGWSINLTPAVYRSDFSGDGFTDLVWRHTTGQLVIWNTAASGISSTNLGNPGPGWQVVGTADFDGDGTSDLLWRDTAGQDTIWRMVNGQHVGGYGLTQVDTSWSVAGTGDFDGDGTSDILWRNANGSNTIWKMQNGQHVGGYGMIGVDTSWTITNVADFNGDGTSDILWRNANGNVQTWLMQNGQHAGGANLGDVDSAWTIRGAADVDGNGIDDILWQRTTGELQVWTMQNGQRTGGGFIETVADPAWRIAGTGDYNADGTADILWRNTSSGQNTIWTMQNGQHVGGTAIDAVADQSWTVSSF